MPTPTPSFPVDIGMEQACQAARALLPNAVIEARPGAFYPKTRFRAEYRGLPVSVLIDKQQTQRQAIQPYTTVMLGGGIAEVPISLGGVHVGYPAYEAHVAFPQPALQDRKLIGAPAALLATLAGGELGDRLAVLPVVFLYAGPLATRAKYDVDGSVLCVRGWPGDAASLEFLIETLYRMREETYAAVPQLAPGARDLAQHPEVLGHAEGRRRARKLGLTIMACVFIAMIVTIAVTVGSLL